MDALIQSDTAVKPPRLQFKHRNAYVGNGGVCVRFHLQTMGADPGRPAFQTLKEQQRQWRERPAPFYKTTHIHDTHRAKDKPRSHRCATGPRYSILNKPYLEEDRSKNMKGKGDSSICRTHLQQRCRAPPGPRHKPVMWMEAQ